MLPPLSRPSSTRLFLSGPPQCIALQPAWGEGYSRLGAAYSGLEDHTAAVQAYQRGLQIHTSTADGSNSSGGDEQLQAALAEAQAAAAASCPFTNPDFLARMASEPRGRELLEQPDFQASKAAGEGRGGRGGGQRGLRPPLLEAQRDFQAGGGQGGGSSPPFWCRGLPGRRAGALQPHCPQIHHTLTHLVTPPSPPPSCGPIIPFP